jgi:hypothetical protein
MGKPAPFWAVGLAAVLVAYGNQFAFSQENAADGPESSPTPATSPAVNSKKSVPAYRAPTVAEITEVLQRVHGRLNEVPVRIVVRKTRKEVTDFSEPMAGLATDPGPEGKFGQFHYGMGVIHSGMLNAFDVTGDKRFADYSVRSFQFLPITLASSRPGRTARPNRAGILSPPRSRCESTIRFACC